LWRKCGSWEITRKVCLDNDRQLKKSSLEERSLPIKMQVR
jgi:hypothetical protein